MGSAARMAQRFKQDVIMNITHKNAFYPCVLDHKPGFFLGWFLYKLFQSVRFDEHISENLKQMHRQGTVVYAVKYRGHLDYLLYHYRFRRARLPYPKIAFDLNISLFLPLSQLIRVLGFHLAYFLRHRRLPNPFETGFVDDSVKKGVTCLLFLVDPKGFRKHFIHEKKDRLQSLLEIQQSSDRSIYLVPHLILYKKTPEKDRPSLMDIFFGFKEKPGAIRKIALFFRHHRRAFIDFGPPLDLKNYLHGQPSGRTTEEMSEEIRQMLINSIDAQKRVILGPVMKSRQQFKEKVLKDSRITDLIRNQANGNPKRLKEFKKQAEGYFDEMAADYNMAYVEFFHLALSWLWKKLFQGIDVNPSQLTLLREWAKKGPMIYVPSHKSHIDYLVLNYVLYEHHMHVPRIAAGKNLLFWPMGRIFRKSGAFFIRRTFKGAKLYTAVFNRYIRALLEEGHPIEFYIEGGRTRTGKLIIPQTGFLSILLQAYLERYCNDLIFVPVSISYDRVIEEKSLLREVEGGAKQEESLKQFWGARQLLKRKYGKIYIRFSRPISLKEYLNEKEVQDKKLLEDLAFRMVRSINKVTLVTPMSLIATGILSRHRRGFHLYDLTQTAKTLLAFIGRYEIPTVIHPNYLKDTVEETLTHLVTRKIVNILKDVDGTETFYYVDEESKRELEYYKNCVIHYFIYHALVAVCLLSGPEDIKTEETLLTEYQFLRDTFKNEFVYSEDGNSRAEVEAAVAYFQDLGLLKRSDGGYRLSKLGFDTLPFWAALAKTFLEAYWIATLSFIQRKDRARTSVELLKNMTYLGIRFNKLGLIEHEEAISQVTFKNAIRFVNDEVLRIRRSSKEDREQAWEKLSRFSQKLYDLAHYRS